MQEYLQKLQERRGSVIATFGTHGGQETLKLLNELFVDVALFDPDPYKMAYKTAAHDVVVLLNDINKSKPV
jgi:hypothetical protein